MDEALVRFEREHLEGVVAVGTYLRDAAKRMGISYAGPCSQAEDVHFCAMQITTGIDLLSPMTGAEREYYNRNSRGTNERLGCQTRVAAPGEIIIMTEKKQEETQSAETEQPEERYKKEFAELPLEKKIATLVQFEAIALGETVSYLINSPFKVFDKAMDVMAEFGFRKDTEEKAAARPKEHRSGTKKKAPRSPRRSKKSSKGESEREA